MCMEYVKGCHGRRSRSYTRAGRRRASGRACREAPSSPWSWSPAHEAMWDQEVLRAEGEGDASPEILEFDLANDARIMRIETQGLKQHHLFLLKRK